MNWSGPPAPPPRRCGARLRLDRRRAMLVYALLLGAWTWFFGMPNDTIQIVLWLWLGTVAWNIEAEPRQHLQFLRDWWPPGAGAGRLLLQPRRRRQPRPRRVSVTMPIDVDRWMFGGHLPTEVAPARVVRQPVRPGERPALVRPDLHHRLRVPLRHRPDHRGRAVGPQPARVHPLDAPPGRRSATPRSRSTSPTRWRRRGGRPATATSTPYLPRITGRGWEDIGIDRLNLLLGGVGNKVAAMPSLHSGHRVPGGGVRHHPAALAGGAGCSSSTPSPWASRWSTTPSTTSSTCSPAGWWRSWCWSAARRGNAPAASAPSRDPRCLLLGLLRPQVDPGVDGVVVDRLQLARR